VNFLKESGLFRIAAVQSDVKGLKQLYDKGFISYLIIAFIQKKKKKKNQLS